MCVVLRLENVIFISSTLRAAHVPHVGVMCLSSRPVLVQYVASSHAAAVRERSKLGCLCTGGTW